MATSIRTHLVGRNENERVSRKGAAQCVTGEHGTGHIVAKLWDLVKPRTDPIREVKKTRSPENPGTGSVQCLPVCWTDVFHDPSVWRDLREMVIGDEADFAA
jgi:hypothetical protein